MGDKSFKKTNAARLLERASICFELISYVPNEEGVLEPSSLPALGLDESMVFKTLVLKGPKAGFFVCCIPLLAEADLKKAARAAGDKSAELIHVKELIGATGYVRGGCSPIGMKKAYPTFIDLSAEGYGKITVSAGARGLLIALNPAELARFINARFADLTLSP